MKSTGRTIDARAVAYGAAAYVIGYFSLAIVTTVIVNRGGFATSVWPAIEICTSLMPVPAGYVGARKARSHRILSGTVAGALGASATLMLFAVLTSSFPAPYIVSLIAGAGLMAALGAVIGNHIASKHAG